MLKSLSNYRKTLDTNLHKEAKLWPMELYENQAIIFFEVLAEVYEFDWIK